MAHSRPIQGIGNKGDEMRLRLAGSEFVYPCCANDPRVRESFEAWSQMRQVAPLVAHLQRTPHDVAAVQALGTAMGPNDDPVNRAWADRLVEDVLRIPYRWVGRLLVAQFGLWVIAAAKGEPEEKIAIGATALRLPKGRLPPLAGGKITEGVHWHYRRDVKAPADELHVLVEEYVRASGRQTEAHSVVQNRIDQVKVFLSLIQPIDR